MKSVLALSFITHYTEYFSMCHYAGFSQIGSHLIRSWVLDVINGHVHQVVAILSGKTNEVMKQNYVLLVVQYDFNIRINRLLLEETGV